MIYMLLNEWMSQNDVVCSCLASDTIMGKTNLNPPGGRSKAKGNKKMHGHTHTHTHTHM